MLINFDIYRKAVLPCDHTDVTSCGIVYLGYPPPSLTIAVFVSGEPFTRLLFLFHILQLLSIRTRDEHRQDRVLSRAGGAPSSLPPWTGSISASVWCEHGRSSDVRSPCCCCWWSPFPPTSCLCHRSSWNLWETHEPPRQSMHHSLFSSQPGPHWGLHSLVFLIYCHYVDFDSKDDWSSLMLLVGVISDDTYPNQDDPPAFHDNEDFGFTLDSKNIRTAFIRKVWKQSD